MATDFAVEWVHRNPNVLISAEPDALYAFGDAQYGPSVRWALSRRCRTVNGFVAVR